MLYDVVMAMKKELEETKLQLREQTEANAMQEQRIADLEKITNSQLIWRIDDYQRKLKNAKSGEAETIFSPEFYTNRNGYRLMASACLNGDGKGKGTHLSVFISVVQGKFFTFVASYEQSVSYKDDRRLIKIGGQQHH